jgi:hypothetical protein
MQNPREIKVDHEVLHPCITDDISVNDAVLDGKAPHVQNIMEAAHCTSYTEPLVLPQMNSSPISRIPNELLNNILAYVVPELDYLGRYWRKRLAIAASISLTSNRLHQIVQPMFYPTIHLADVDDFLLTPLSQNAKLFFRILESNPALRSFANISASDLIVKS